MAKIQVYNLEGKVVDSIELSDRVFSLPDNNTLLQEVYISLSANERKVYAHTKGRGERQGSGRKPWKQKHTGRARVGSVRSPLWRKGGVVFGPKSERNFSKKINQKVRQKSVMLALSGKVRSGELFVVDSLSLSEYKTRRVVEALSALNILGKSVLLGFSKNEIEIQRAGRNVEKLSPTSLHTINTKDLLDHRFLLLSQGSVRELESRFISAS